MSGALRFRLWILIAITLLAAMVRAPFLLHSLWYDEIAAFLGYSLPGPWAAVGTYFTQANHVFHSFLAWMSTAIFGVDELSVRLPSFLAGLGTVWAVAMLGREVGGASLAMMAALVTALMPTAVLASTEARGYSLMMFFAALMTALLMRAQRLSGSDRSQRIANWCLYAAVCALGVWSHLVTVCVPIFHAIACVVIAIRARKLSNRNAARFAISALIALCGAGILTALLYAPIMSQMVKIQREFRALDGNEPTLFSHEGWMMLCSLGGSWSGWSSLAALILAGSGVRASMGNSRLRMAVVLALGGTAVALLFPLVLGSWLYARFLAFAAPGVALLIAAGIVWIGNKRPMVAWGLAIATLISWSTLLINLGPRQQIREAVAYVATHRAAGEGAFAVGLPDDVHRWYSTALNIEMPGSGPYGQAVSARIAEGNNRWAVLLYPRALKQASEALREAGYTVEASFPGWIDEGDGAIVVLRRR